jgi:type VI secretion system protein ImpL
VPALYTRAVFERSLAERTRDVLAQFERERAWVLGAGAPAATGGDAQAVAPQVQQLYLADYARRWDDYLGDLRLAAAPTLAASAEQAALLARAESPLTALLRAAANELSIAQLAGARFGALPRWIAAPPGPDALQATFGAVAAHLTAVDDAAKRQALPPGSDVLRDLAQAAAQAPEPLRGWLAAFAAHAGKQAFAALREPLARQVAAEIAPQCARLVGTQYPLQRNGVEELSRDAFVRTFAAGGLLDAYFQRQLAPHVDTTTRPWTFRAGGGASEALAAFQRAQAIRDAFFRDGGRAFSVRMEMKLVELDPGVGEFVLDVDGSQPLRFKRGTTHTLAWPGANDGTRVQLQLVAANGTAGTPYAFQGPWALFKLLDRVRSEPGPASDRLRLVFDVEGRKARFEVRTSGALNPIARQDLEQFQCPKGL